MSLVLPTQATAQPQPFAGLETYLQRVERYRGKGNDDDVAALARWPRAQLEDAVSLWGRVVNDVRYRTIAQQRQALLTALDRRSFEAAAVLHAAAGMVAFDAGDSPRSAFHFSLANRIIALRDTFSPAQDAWQRRRDHLFNANWHRLIATFFHSRLAPESAGPHIEKALEMLPDDSDLVLAAARIFEASHDARSKRTVAPRALSAFARGPTRQAAMLDQLRSEHDLARAETLLRTAIARDHEPAMARVRLGWVLHARRRSEDAAAELAAAAKLPHTARIGYLAHLFLARIAEEQRDATRALEHYAAATKMQASNQTARIAMARLLAEDGQADAAGDAALAALMTTRELSDDPWWSYYYPDENAVSDLIDALRKGSQ